MHHVGFTEYQPWKYPCYWMLNLTKLHSLVSLLLKLLNLMSMSKPVWPWRSPSGPVSTAEFQQHPCCFVVPTLPKLTHELLKFQLWLWVSPLPKEQKSQFCSLSRQTSFNVHNHPVPTTSVAVECLCGCELGPTSHTSGLLLIPKGYWKYEEIISGKLWREGSKIL